MPEQSFRLILASGSPARRELLEKGGYRFEVMPANIDEPTGEDAADPRAYVHQVAWSKAAAVAPRVPYGVVLAADTVGWLDGRIIGINRRFRDGSKKHLKGTKRGLTYAEDWATTDGPILLPEGGSDTAALLTMGLAAIGRPSRPLSSPSGL